MNDSERKHYERFVRVRQFGMTNAADFPSPTKGNQFFTELGTIIDEIENESSDQQAGFGEARQQYEIKATARKALRTAMAEISTTAKSMEIEYDGIADKFKFQQNTPDEMLLAKSRAFATEANDYIDQFEEWGLAATFITDLTDLANAFEDSFSSTAAAIAEHVEATADTRSRIKAGSKRVEALKAIVMNKYKDNPGKLAAWKSASRLEKTKQNKDDEPTEDE